MRVKYVFHPEVTEEEWLDLEASDTYAVWRSMPHPEGYRDPDRKKLLLVAHLVRQVSDQMTDPRLVAVIEAGEKWADGLIDDAEARAVHEQAEEVYESVRQPQRAAADAAAVARRFLYEQNETVELLVSAAGSRAIHLAGPPADASGTVGDEARYAMQAQIRWLINEVHGNPFRPVSFSPSCRTDDVMSLARRIYDRRDFDVMPVLAATLEKLGCSGAVVDHLRLPGAHIPGCWALDAVLGNG